MNIQFQGKFSKNEYRQAFRLHYKSSGCLRWFACGPALLFLFAAIFLIVREPALARYLVPGGIFIIAICTVSFWLPEIQAASFNRPDNIFREGLSGTINDEGIFVQTSKGNSNIFWNAYTGYKQTRDLILLYQNKNCFNIFTRGMFSGAGDWELFCGEIAGRLKKK